NRLGGLGSTLRRKGRSSDSCGAAQALTRRLRPSASGLPPFSGSGLKWALSKARPRRDAAKDKTARALARRVAGHSCARSRFPTTSIIRRSVGSTPATPPKPDRAGHRSFWCERACAGPPLRGPFELPEPDELRPPPLRLTRAMQAGRVLSRIGDNDPSERSTCASGRARAALSCRGGRGFESWA